MVSFVRHYSLLVAFKTVQELYLLTAMALLNGHGWLCQHQMRRGGTTAATPKDGRALSGAELWNRPR